MHRNSAHRPISVLLIGYGVRGRQWERWISGHRAVELAGVVDPAPAVAAELNDRDIRCDESVQEALTRGGFDAAIVASPPECHVEQACGCLSAGLNVMVEKPLSTSLVSAAKVPEAADAAGRAALVGQNFRFIAREHHVQKALPEIGGFVGGTIRSARPPEIARPHVGTDPFGPLWDISLHHLDTLRMRFGLPCSVVGRMRPLPSGRDGHIAYELELTWVNGARVQYHHSEGAPGFHHVEYLEGRDGVITVDDERVALAPSHRRARRLFALRIPDPHVVLLDRLAEVALGKSPRELSARENLATVALAEAACLAMSEERPVRLRDVIERAAVVSGKVA